MTDKQRKAWLAERRLGIGGSDIAAIIGVNKYSSPLDVWRSKMPDATDKDTTEDMMRGQMLEEFVAKMYSFKSGNRVFKPRQALYVHPEFDHIRASPDRFYGSTSHPGVLECKTIARKTDHDNIPEHWVCQLQWTMMVTGASVGTIVWCSPPGFSIEFLEIEANPEFQALMLEAAHDFWNNYVVPCVPPPPQTSEDVESIYPKSVEKEIEATEEVLEAAIEYRKLLDAEKTIDAAKKTLSDQIKSFMLDADKLKYGDRLVATFKSSKDGVSINADKLLADLPEVYKAYSVAKPGARRLIIKEE